MGATARLAEWAVGVRYEDIPEEAIAAAKRAILDCTGCALAGGDERVARALYHLGQQAGGEGEASILGSAERASAQWAALVNGTLAHALDYDDVHMGVHGHPTAPTLPAGLALGEVRDASGRELLAAYVVGVEVMGRLGGVVNPTHYDRGWHATATLGASGAAVAGARMLQLEPTQLRHALGMACSFASGLRQNFGTDTKPLHAGAAARNGVLAAQLAAEGVDADPNIFEAPNGFCSVAGVPGRVLEESDLADLGRAWQVVNPGLGFKLFPSCYSTHRPINAVLALAERYDLAPERVERVECAASYSAVQMLIHARPKTALEGKFSMQYCLAAALIDRRVGLSHFTDEQVNRADIQALIPRVSVSVHPDLARPEQLSADFAEVTVQLVDGRSYTERVEFPAGHARRPLTDAELDAKYLECAGLRLGRDGAQRSLERLRNLERLESVRKLVTYLVPAVAVGA